VKNSRRKTNMCDSCRPAVVLCKSYFRCVCHGNYGVATPCSDDLLLSITFVLAIRLSIQLHRYSAFNRWAIHCTNPRRRYIFGGW